MVMVSALTIQLMAGCAAKKNMYGDSRSGYRLEYRMPKGEPYQYDLKSEFVSTMDVMGQKIEVASNARNLFTLTPAGLSNGNYRYKVSIDSAQIQFNTPRGEIVPDMGKITGAEFQFEVTPKGREIDCSGAEKLKYNLGEYEELDLSGDFKTLFPDLPATPVKQGDSWATVDTLVEKSNSGFLQFVTLSTHTVEAAEPYAGMDCLRIHTTFTGTIGGDGTMQEATTSTSGTLEGESTWYFAYKEGRFIKSEMQGKAVTNTKASAPGREIEIPSARRYSNSTTLVME